MSSLIPKPPARKPAPPSNARQSEEGAETGTLTPGTDRGRFRDLDIDLIRPNRSQPRQKFDVVALEELANSLINKGVIQPITVRSIEGGKYELVAGERRWRAAQRAGLHKIPAVIRQVPDNELLEMALIENLQREELNPIEEAVAFRSLMNDLGLTQQEVADKVGKRRATIANTLRLLSLSKAVQDKVRSGAVSMGHARALVPLTDTRRQLALAWKIEKKGLSVRQVETMVARLIQDHGMTAVKSAKKVDPNIEAAVESLQSVLGARVRIVQGRKGGRLELHYHNDDELQRIYGLIYKAAEGESRESAQ